MVQLTFENPLYLWYLISIPLLIASHFYFLRYAKFRGMRFANFEALQRVSGEKIFTKNYLQLGLRILILLSLILAASGATVWYKGEVSQNDFVVALDVSASMTSQDVKPSRIEAAKDTVKQFLSRMEENDMSARVGVLTFSGATYIEQRLTEDFDKVRTALDEVRVRREGGTDIAGAVVTGTNLLLGVERGRNLIMISDGSVTVSSQSDNSFRNALDYAKEEKIIVHTMGIGTETGPIGYLPEYYNATSVFKEETLKNLANSTDGTFHNINTEEDRVTAYETIGEESNQAMIDVDLSYGLLLAALFLIFLEWGLVSTKFRRLP